MRAFQGATVFVSPQLLDEYRNVPLELAARNKINHEQFKALITGIAAFAFVATVVFPRERLFLCRDPEDDMILECCLEADSEILITGDKDLLDIGTLPFPLEILNPAAYISKDSSSRK